MSAPAPLLIGLDLDATLTGGLVTRWGAAAPPPPVVIRAAYRAPARLTAFAAPARSTEFGSGHGPGGQTRPPHA